MATNSAKANKHSHLHPENTSPVGTHHLCDFPYLWFTKCALAEYFRAWQQLLHFAM